MASYTVYSLHCQLIYTLAIYNLNPMNTTAYHIMQPQMWESVTLMLQCATSVTFYPTQKIEKPWKLVASAQAQVEPIDPAPLAPCSNTAIQTVHKISQNSAGPTKMQDRSATSSRRQLFNFQRSLVAGLSRGQRTVKTSKLKHFL